MGRKSRAKRLAEITDKLNTIQVEIENLIPKLDDDEEELPEDESAKLIEQINNLIGQIPDHVSLIEELKEEIESWKENLPENLQSSEKADKLDECAGTLEDGIYNLESVNDIEDLHDAQGVVDEMADAISTLEGVEFPTMFG